MEESKYKVFMMVNTKKCNKQTATNNKNKLKEQY